MPVGGRLILSIFLFRDLSTLGYKNKNIIGKLPFNWVGLVASTKHFDVCHYHLTSRVCLWPKGQGNSTSVFTVMILSEYRGEKVPQYYARYSQIYFAEPISVTYKFNAVDYRGVGREVESEASEPRHHEKEYLY